MVFVQDCRDLVEQCRHVGYGLAASVLVPMLEEVGQDGGANPSRHRMGVGANGLR
jgi:hypothetical protein